MRTEGAARLAVLLTTALLLAGCTGDADEPGASTPAPSATPTPSGRVVPGTSTPVEDEVYPESAIRGGRAGYQLDLDWDPAGRP